MAGERARTALAGTRFADVRWVDETGSTNADAIALARAGGSEGIVLVADHQTAGRGRQGRTWEAPPAASLLMTVLLRPPPLVAGATTMVVGLAAAEAVEQLTGQRARLKWPNDLVIDDRKAAGILAEADWHEDEVAVAVGLGLNVVWPDAVPVELREAATAINRLSHTAVDREDLLIAVLGALDRRYAGLLEPGGPAAVVVAWRERSATLGRRVRLDLGASSVIGTAVDVDADGHLVLECDGGSRRTFSAGDVIHLRPA